MKIQIQFLTRYNCLIQFAFQGQILLKFLKLLLDQRNVNMELVPLGKTILRQVSFN